MFNIPADSVPEILFVVSDLVTRSDFSFYMNHQYNKQNSLLQKNSSFNSSMERYEPYTTDNQTDNLLSSTQRKLWSLAQSLVLSSFITSSLLQSLRLRLDLLLRFDLKNPTTTALHPFRYV